MKSLVFLTAWCIITVSLVTCSPDSPLGGLLNPLKDLVGNLTGGKLTDFLSPTTKKIVFTDDAETTASSAWSVSETTAQTAETAKPAKAISFEDETTTTPVPAAPTTVASSTSESQIPSPSSTNSQGSMRTINSGPTFIFIG